MNLGEAINTDKPFGVVVGGIGYAHFAYVWANDKYWVLRIPVIPTVVVTPNSDFPVRTYTVERSFKVVINGLD